MAVSANLEGIDVSRVTDWFERHVPDVAPPLQFELIAGGRSNLTFEVVDSRSGRWVLRRPPLGQVLATAHDMGREHRIISALAGTDVPVPRTIGICVDDEVNGAPFYVMGFVDGTVLRNAEIGRGLGEATRRTAGESIADVLAAIHLVDVDDVGLGTLGRRGGYIERQLKRWRGQWEQSKTREVPAVDAVHDLLSSAVPDQGPATIVHGDYRLDNCLLDDDGTIGAVIDWELCTLGDPMADVGLLMVYWAEEGEDRPGLLDAATALPGFPTRAELLERYSAASGRVVEGIDFYVAFGYWKLACILEGVYARYRGGAMGSANDEGFELFAAQVNRLAEAAREAAARND